MSVPRRVLARHWRCVFAAVALLTGCAQAPRSMYHWAGFQDQLYVHFKNDGASPDEQLRALVAGADMARGENLPLPPGFRAHMAMLCLRLGRDDDARAHLEGEKASFPESAQYMDFLLSNMASMGASK